MFRCGDGVTCVPFSLRCNGHVDCDTDAADEADCPPVCGADQFQVRCYLPEWSVTYRRTC